MPELPPLQTKEKASHSSERNPRSAPAIEQEASPPHSSHLQVMPRAARNRRFVRAGIQPHSLSQLFLGTKRSRVPLRTGQASAVPKMLCAQLLRLPRGCSDRKVAATLRRDPAGSNQHTRCRPPYEWPPKKDPAMREIAHGEDRIAKPFAIAAPRCGLRRPMWRTLAVRPSRNAELTCQPQQTPRPTQPEAVFGSLRPRHG